MEGRDQNNANDSYVLFFVTIIYVEGPELGSRKQICITNVGNYLSRKGSECVWWK